MITKTKEVITLLHQLANPEIVSDKKKKFGVDYDQTALGVYLKDLNEIARQNKRNNQLAIELYDSNIYEGKLLCSKIFSPKELTSDLMEKWVTEFNNWEICDSFSMTLFARSNYAVEKAMLWYSREAEFQRRSAFAIIAALCNADKKSENQVFEQFLQPIVSCANDDRNFVKKAVSWALRSIGKRNQDLKLIAINCAKEMSNHVTKSAQWIASDTLRELQSDKVRISNYPKAIYAK